LSAEAQAAIERLARTLRGLGITGLAIEGHTDNQGSATYNQRLSERLPVHQTLSHAQTRRFVDAALFERLFLRSLELCRQHGLVEGTHLSIDGFHAEADAALASLRASLALAPAPKAEAGDDAEAGESGPPEPTGQLALDEESACARQGEDRPVLALAEPPRPDHAADALAVAICHHNSAPLAQAVAAAHAPPTVGSSA